MHNVYMTLLQARASLVLAYALQISMHRAGLRCTR